MARRHHYKRRAKDGHEIDVTTFLNLMVVLVPFLLVTAVFSRLSIVELNLPSTAGGPTPNEQGFRPEVIVRDAGIEISNGASIIATIPKVDDEYDLKTLSDFMVELKQEYPEQDAASVLMERQIPYDYLIQVMDVVRSVEIAEENPGGPQDTDGLQVPDGLQDPDGLQVPNGFQLYALFTEISVGDAP